MIDLRYLAYCRCVIHLKIFKNLFANYYKIFLFNTIKLTVNYEKHNVNAKL